MESAPLMDQRDLVSEKINRRRLAVPALLSNRMEFSPEKSLVC